MEFRNLRTKRIRRADPGSVRYALMQRSERYEAVDGEPAPVEEQQAPQGHFESRTKAELLEIAADMGIEIPKRATKAEIISRLREG